MKKRNLLLLTALLSALFLLAEGGSKPADGTEALHQWQAGTIVSPEAVRAFGLDKCFSAGEISDALFARINGKSYQPNPYIRRADLRHVRVLHYDRNGLIRIGEMVCNKTIAQELVEIFRELYRHKYPIERMQLIDDYGADDERSMRANNSSCFCYRTVANSKQLSKHARGLAVDINPLYNPYVRRRADGSEKIQPATAARYCDRTKSFPYKIDRNDLCYRLFTSHGFRWGGTWKSVKDYQHYEKLRFKDELRHLSFGSNKMEL